MSRLFAKPRAPPPRHVALEELDTPEPALAQCGARYPGPRSVLTIHYERIVESHGDPGRPAQQPPVGNMQRPRNVTTRELFPRPDVEDPRRRACRDQGEQIRCGHRRHLTGCTCTTIMPCSRGKAALNRL